jgi:hypothetical protein
MPLDFSPKQPPAQPEQIAQALKTQAKSVYLNMVNTFNRGSKMFWNNPNATPEQLSAALGNDAKQLFELHYKLGQLISTIDATAISEGSSVVGQFTMNEDGTVTILPPSGNP